MEFARVVTKDEMLDYLTKSTPYTLKDLEELLNSESSWTLASLYKLALENEVAS